VSGKVYIGQTKYVKSNVRKNVHLFELRHNKHGNRHLQFAFNKYGEQALVFDIIRKVEDDKTTIYEQFYVNLYQSNDDKYGYNIRPAVDSNFGIKHGRQSKAVIDNRTFKMWITRRKNGTDARGAANPFFGRFYTLDERIAMSKSGFPGTKFHVKSKTRPWQAKIWINNKEKSLGYFETQLEAFDAYTKKYYELEAEQKSRNTAQSEG